MKTHKISVAQRSQRANVLSSAASFRYFLFLVNVFDSYADEHIHKLSVLGQEAKYSHVMFSGEWNFLERKILKL